MSFVDERAMASRVTSVVVRTTFDAKGVTVVWAFPVGGRVRSFGRSGGISRPTPEVDVDEGVVASQ